MSTIITKRKKSLSALLATVLMLVLCMSNAIPAQAAAASGYGHRVTLTGSSLLQ